MERMLLECRRLIVRLTADRKRFTVLCMLTAIALVFWTRLVLHDRVGQVAMADEQVTVAMMDPVINSVSVPVRVVLPEKPERNPFSVSSTFFPVSEETSSASPNSPKSVAKTTDLTAEAASSLRLGATLPPSAAVIDGVTVRVGQAVSGVLDDRFELVEVHRTYAVLETQGRQFVLRMD